MDKYTCRGCGKELNGTGKSGDSVMIPGTRDTAKWNYYGGYVCSANCDYRASLELEQSMPGHQGQKVLTITSESYKSYKRNTHAN